MEDQDCAPRFASDLLFGMFCVPEHGTIRTWHTRGPGGADGREIFLGACIPHFYGRLLRCPMGKLLVTPLRKEQAEGKPDRMVMRTVASMARVSISTVSRTMNGISTVDPEMARRVRKVVNELNYTRNTQARALVSGRSWTLGVIVSEMTNLFIPELIHTLEDVAVEYGYEILVTTTRNDSRRLSSCIRRLLERNVDGVVVMSEGLEYCFLNQFIERSIPVAAVDIEAGYIGISHLKVNYRHGIRQGVQHLAALGHGDIAFVAATMPFGPAKPCVTAFLASLEECGIEPDPSCVLASDPTMVGGMAAMERLLNMPVVPTAVMCSNDIVAVGMLNRLYRVGLRAPNDISVIAFDSIHPEKMTIPPLTTIEISRIELAKAAVRTLRSQIERSEITPLRQICDIRTTLIVRQSTGFPRGTIRQSNDPSSRM